MLRAVSSPSSEDDLQADQVLSAGGSYKQRELKRIARRMRRSVLGPTSVYYAGVTAPAIAAGMATVCSAAFSRAGWDPYWVLMASAIMASMAGISWYLIFMRLAYRHGFGRGTEKNETTNMRFDWQGVTWERGQMRAEVAWPGISGIDLKKSFIHVRVIDGEDLILPRSWFQRRTDMKDFADKLTRMRKEFSARG
ncbi:hypothetical protein [Ponticaulis profundi]|uniref:YcxB-like protein domain-containing protein n=1 Tax=Ponticaulis profundi TaxID=2665222 RepID=A0ABW1S905_9PROT